jgi:hypothetical protein
MSDEQESKRIRKNDSELTSLEQLKKFTVVVADTGEFETIAKYSPQGILLIVVILMYIDHPMSMQIQRRIHL